MRRADRLFQIAQHLRARRLTMAQQLAEWLAVSERTIYRDIRDLSLSGVPVEGEAGVGYRIKAGYDLQPLMFSPEEIEALVTGMRMVQSWGGPQLAAAGAAALAKVTLALPQERRAFVEATPLFAPNFHIDPAHGKRLDGMRRAVNERRTLHLDYADASGAATTRTIWPLALYFWGGGWSIAAWCELRQDFRNFRVDRVREAAPGQAYPDMQGRRLADFIRAMQGRSRSG